MTTTDIADRPGSQLSVDALQRAVGRLLAAHSVTALRISLGLIIAGFGALALSNAFAHEALRQTKETLEQQLEQRTLAFEKALAELQETKAKGTSV